ncbi:Stp1/IreP family PP2C-type Ser/Thr phosphatase [Alkalicoccus chagannorensis]|uniref:Stp1/IreP family PP2C-type Ser/Thr phosphatase n=1 Tax=Alkalicoccus chagannorensis TaxID=427072 RepID=UPI00047BFEFE|nr:Stp1/IreP family PP2C-type Ser/Thr phosphatase [Alkalicoccus chagannorensis]
MLYAGTDKGKVRKLNEDSYVTASHQNLLLAAVADGMGGHKAGDVASGIVCRVIRDKFEKEPGPLDASWLESAVADANREVFSYQEKYPEYHGMGTTVTAVLCQGREVLFANVGDSRLYHLHQHGITQVSSDDSFVAELVRQGELTAEEAERHPKKNLLLKAVGTDTDLEVSTGSLLLREGDKLLLCSDGLTDKLSEDDIDTIVRNHDPDEAPGQCINLANERGGEDNITLVLVQPFESGRI